MRIFFTFLFIISTLFGLKAQEEMPVDSPNQSNFVINDFAYPRFMNEEEHSSFFLNYQLSRNSQIELQAFYDTYLLSNRFRNSLAFKQYLSDKFYLFAGLEIEAEYVKMNLIQKRPLRIGVISGFGYDVNSNFTMEAKSNIGINKSSMGVFGEPFIPMPQVYTLGGKIKF